MVRELRVLMQEADNNGGTVMQHKFQATVSMMRMDMMTSINVDIARGMPV
jgi:hypothetical protein